jgi:hypothetical protein
MGTVKIDCDDCAVRGPGCTDCVVSVLLGVPETLLDAERMALEVLADVGLAPRLRLVKFASSVGQGRCRFVTYLRLLSSSTRLRHGS